jgi:hypothetical protein
MQGLQHLDSLGGDFVPVQENAAIAKPAVASNSLKSVGDST